MAGGSGRATARSPSASSSTATVLPGACTAAAAAAAAAPTPWRTSMLCLQSSAASALPLPVFMLPALAPDIAAFRAATGVPSARSRILQPTPSKVQNPRSEHLLLDKCSSNPLLQWCSDCDCWYKAGRSQQELSSGLSVLQAWSGGSTEDHRSPESQGIRAEDRPTGCHSSIRTPLRLQLQEVELQEEVLRVLPGVAAATRPPQSTHASAPRACMRPPGADILVTCAGCSSLFRQRVRGSRSALKPSRGRQPPHLSLAALLCRRGPSAARRASATTATISRLRDQRARPRRGSPSSICTAGVRGAAPHHPLLRPGLPATGALSVHAASPLHSGD